MRVIVLIAVSGCWTGKPPPPPAPTGCTIRERLVETDHPAKLSIEHQQFAELDGPFVRIDVTVAGSEAKARVETEQVVLEGQLGLDDFPVRPKQIALRDGWLEVTHAIGRAALDSSLRLEVDLPHGLLPQWTSIDVPCDALTFARPPEDAPLGDDDLVLPPGTATTLFRAPGKNVIGTWTAPKKSADEPYQYLEAKLIERSGAFVRIRIQDKNAVVAWVAASAMETREADVYGGLLGGTPGVLGRRIQCPHEVPIYVRIDSAVSRVGTTKPDAVFVTGANRRDELEIDLGEGAARPFLRRKDLDRCGYP